MTDLRTPSPSPVYTETTTGLGFFTVGAAIKAAALDFIPARFALRREGYTDTVVHDGRVVYMGRKVRKQ